MRTLARLCRLTLPVLLLAAGCSSGSSSPTEPPPSLTDAQLEAQMLQRLNDARVAQGLNAVALDPAVRSVARQHSRNMRDNGFFGHQDSAGLTVTGRLMAAGVPFSQAGENLARVENAADPVALAHNELIQSAEHRPVMLNPNFTEVGIGIARSGSTFWFTQVFVRR